MCFKLVKNNLRKVAGLFCTFLTIPVGVEKYVELIEKNVGGKQVMQSSSSENCLRVYNIKILNFFTKNFNWLTRNP